MFMTLTYFCKEENCFFDAINTDINVETCQRIDDSREPIRAEPKIKSLI